MTPLTSDPTPSDGHARTATDPTAHDEPAAMAAADPPPVGAAAVGVAPVATPRTESGPDLVEPDRIMWRSSPIDRGGFGIALLTFVIATACSIGIGFAIVEWWDGSSLGEWDADINRRLEAGRTSGATTVAEYVSQSSDTITKILLGVILIPVMLWLFRRWHEWTLIIGGLVLEVCIFGLSSMIVGRERPPVEQLDGAPTDSFPSGHIAAATVFYAGLAVVIFMRTERRGPRIIAAIIGVGMPVAVAWARMYLGMHYITDAIAGVALGVVTLAVMYRIVHRTLPDHESPAAHDRAAAAIGGRA
jgi:membrane-associated phospholipid phosphatase